MGRRPPGASGGRPSPARTPGRAARRESPRERVPARSPVRDAMFWLARSVTSDRLPPRAAAAGSRSGKTRFPRGRVRAPEFFDDVPSVGAARRGMLCIPFVEQRRAEFATGPRLDGRPESHRNPTWGAFDKVRRGGATASVDEARSRFERASADARVAAQRRVAENCGPAPRPARFNETLAAGCTELASVNLRVAPQPSVRRTPTRAPNRGRSARPQAAQNACPDLHGSNRRDPATPHAATRSPAAVGAMASLPESKRRRTRCAAASAAKMIPCPAPYRRARPDPMEEPLLASDPISTPQARQASAGARPDFHPS